MSKVYVVLRPKYYSVSVLGGSTTALDHIVFGVYSTREIAEKIRPVATDRSPAAFPGNNWKIVEVELDKLYKTAELEWPEIVEPDYESTAKEFEDFFTGKAWKEPLE